MVQGCGRVRFPGVGEGRVAGQLEPVRRASAEPLVCGGQPVQAVPITIAESKTVSLQRKTHTTSRMSGRTKTQAAHQNPTPSAKVPGVQHYSQPPALAGGKKARRSLPLGTDGQCHGRNPKPLVRSQVR